MRGSNSDGQGSLSDAAGAGEWHLFATSTPHVLCHPLRKHCLSNKILRAAQLSNHQRTPGRSQPPEQAPLHQPFTKEKALRRTMIQIIHQETRNSTMLAAIPSIPGHELVVVGSVKHRTTFYP